MEHQSQDDGQRWIAELSDPLPGQRETPDDAQAEIDQLKNL